MCHLGRGQRNARATWKAWTGSNPLNTWGRKVNIKRIIHVILREVHKTWGKNVQVEPIRWVARTLTTMFLLEHNLFESREFCLFHHCCFRSAILSKFIEWMFCYTMSYNNLNTERTPAYIVHNHGKLSHRPACYPTVKCLPSLRKVSVSEKHTHYFNNKTSSLCSLFLP